VFWIAAAVLLFLLAASLGGLLLRIYRSTPEVSITRFFISMPDHWALVQAYNGPLISPDGMRVAFVARNTAGKSALWVRSLDTLVAQSVPGTDGAYSPFWSPDSHSLAFFAQTKLKRIDVVGGAAQELCDASTGRGGTWNHEGVILFGAGAGPILRVNAGGGQPAAATKLSAGQVNHRSPSFLPDGKHFLYYSVGSPEIKGIYISSLDGGEPLRLFDADTNAIYASGQLLFVQNSALMRRPFNAATLQFSGDSVPVADSVGTDGTNIAAVSVSDNGTLVYRDIAGLSEGRQLGLYDRTGKLIDRVGSPGRYIGLDLSPDGKRLAVHRHDGNGGDIWIIELFRGAFSLFTHDTAQDNSMPIWSPDGTNIVFSSMRNGKWGLYEKPANGSGKEQLLYESASGDLAPMSWSADDRFIVFQATGARTAWDLWVLPLTGDRKAYPMIDSPSNETWAEVSPDSKWIVYNSDETGRYEIYLRPFPKGEGIWPVSTNGGWYPRWRKKGEGKELFFADAAVNGKLLSVKVNTSGATPEFSAATPLFDSGYINISHGVHHKYAVTPDGQHFIIPRPESAVSGESSELPPPITVVLNWASTLNKK
jgi:Tol biopolymer transport system component